MATKSVNAKSPTIRRILREAHELASTPSPDFHAAPSESDLFSWHFTIRGPPSSPYASGIYHGRIVLPPQYPLRPPSFRFMTPTGRFEVNREICLSISGHHEETWMPAWGVRTAMLALRSFMEQPSEGQVGGMDMDDESRRRLAEQSISWKCEECGKTNEEILKETAEAAATSEGGHRLDDKVPEELKLGYREDIEKKATAGASAESSAAAEAREARAKAVEERLAREAAARATLARVGVSAGNGTSTPPAPTRQDSEDIARAAATFPPAVSSPIPRGYQSPHQLEPMVGSPPQVYSRPVARPGQTVPAPTSSLTTSFQAAAYPPPPRDPSATRTSLVSPPLTAHEFLRQTEEIIQRQNAPPMPNGTQSPAHISAHLSPSLIRAQAEAASRYFESQNAAANPNRGLRQRPVYDANSHVEETMLARGRALDARRMPPRGRVLVWLDSLLVFLIIMLGCTVLRWIAIHLNALKAMEEARNGAR